MKHWKLTLAFAAVFVAGLVVGALLAMRFLAPPFGHPPDAAKLTSYVMKRLKSDLSLTSEQTAQIEPIVQRTTMETISLHRELSQRLDVAINASDLEIEKLLNAEQKARFEKVRASRPHFDDKP